MTKPALIELLAKEIGGSFDITEGDIPIGTSPTVIVPDDYDRLALVIVSNGPSAVYVSTNNLVTTTTGIPLTGAGSDVSMIARDDFVLVGRGWYGVAAATGSSVHYLAVRRISWA